MIRMPPPHLRGVKIPIKIGIQRIGFANWVPVQQYGQFRLGLVKSSAAEQQHIHGVKPIESLVSLDAAGKYPALVSDDNIAEMESWSLSARPCYDWQHH